MAYYSKKPVSVRLVLTGKCNLHCNYCFMDAGKTGNPDELSTARWLTFIERLRELHVFDIVLNGGEIFLRDDLFVIIKKIRDNRMHKLTLFTNGTLITPKVAGRLSDLKIKNIVVSLDGLENCHDELRGKGAFQKTINGIRNLTAAGIFPQVAFTPVKTNYKDLGGLIDLLADLKITFLQLNTLSPEGRCMNIYKKLVLGFPGQIKESLDIINEKRRQFPDIKINCAIGFYYHLPESYGYFQENPQNYKVKHLKEGCSAASRACTITPTGDVIPCEGFPTFVGGNIKEKDILDIWNNSESFKKIRELADVAMDQTPYCKECKYIYICNGGCRATAYKVYNDLLAPAVTCPFFQGKNGENVREDK